MALNTTRFSLFKLKLKWLINAGASLHSHLYFPQNNHLVLTILKAYFIIYVIDLSTKNKNVMTGVHIFTKIKNTDRWKFFWVNSFQKILIFHIFGFSENAQ